MMTRKKIALGGLGAVLGLVLAVVAVWIYIGRQGSTRLEQWIGRNIVSVLQSHLNPTVKFEMLDYQAPRSVVVEGLTFTSGQVAMMTIDRMYLELAEVPRVGQPIKIEDVRFDRPRFRFVEGADGSVVGWGNFVKTQAVKNPETVEPGSRFSDVLVLRHMAIQDGEVVYEPLNERPMVLPGITMELKTPPAGSEPGWYQIAGTLQREKLFQVRVDGRINLDTALLELAELSLEAALQENEYGEFPPALQETLRRHAIRGALTARARGQIPLNDWTRGEAELSVELADAQFADRGFRFPLGHVALAARLVNGAVQVQRAEARELAMMFGEQTLASVKGLSLEIGETVAGKPLEIRRVRIDSPLVRLAERTDKGLVGWGQLGGLDDAEAEDDTRLSDLVVLHELVVEGGQFVYDFAGDGEFVLPGINIHVQMPPDAAAPGVYGLSGSIRQEPLLDVAFNGRLNIDEAVLDLESVKLNSSIGEEQYDLLPPQLRGPLREYQLRGQLAATASGRLPLSDPEKANLRLEASLTNLSMVYSGVEIPVAETRLAADWSGGRVRMEPTVIRNLGLRHGQTNALEVEQIRIDLPELPPRNEPMRIHEIEVTRPSFRFIEAADGTLQGWSALTSGGGAAATRPAGADEDSVAAGNVTTQPVDQQDFTENFVIASLVVREAQVLYKPQGPGEAMLLQGVNLTVKADPVAPTGDHYRIDTSLVRQDLFDIQVRGALDVERWRLQLERLQASVNLTSQQYNLFPPQMQGMLKEYGVQGRFSATVSGMLPLTQFERADLAGQVRLENGQFRHGKAIFPVESAAVDATWRAGALALQPITVNGFSLSYGDERLIGIEQTVVELGPLPQGEQPLVIRRVDITAPQVRLVSRPEGGFNGWSQLFAGDPDAAAEAGTQGTPAPRTQSAGQPPVLESLRVRNGAVVYVGEDRQTPMVLDAINVDLQLNPAVGGPQVYGINATIHRDRLFKLTLDGRINTQTLLLGLERLELKAGLGPNEYQTFPPAVQAVLREREIRGELSLTAQGQVPLSEPLRSEVQSQVTLANGRFAMGEHAFPVDELRLGVNLAGGKLNTQYSANLVGGQATGALSLGLEGDRPMQLNWNVEGVRIERTLRALQQGEPKYAGRLNAQGQIQMLLQRENALQGQGSVRVEDGRLVNLPILGTVLRLVTERLLGGVGAQRDRGAMDFTLTADRMHIKRFEVISALTAATGSGDVFYDGRLNLEVQAGPVEKLESQLGRIGSLIGAVTDRLVSYQVTGTTSDPKVRVKPLGLGR